MKYTKCPTCGGQAKIISKNFETAGILIYNENDQFKREYEFISRQLEQACLDLEKKVEHLSSDQLFFLYRNKLQQEIRQEAINTDINSELIKERYEKALHRFMYKELPLITTSEIEN